VVCFFRRQAVHMLEINKPRSQIAAAKRADRVRPRARRARAQIGPRCASAGPKDRT
jgi:hypothetical protein